MSLGFKRLKIKSTKTAVNNNEHVRNTNLFYDIGLANQFSHYFISALNATPRIPLPFS